MTARERQTLAALVDAQVREREEKHRADRQLTRDLVTSRPRRRRARRRQRCIYCGGRSFGRACHAHKDLIQIEAAAA